MIKKSSSPSQCGDAVWGTPPVEADGEEVNGLQREGGW